MNLSLTPEHWIFIPSVFFLGWTVGFLMGKARSFPPPDKKILKKGQKDEASHG